MDELRVILLAIGLLVIVGIIFWHKRRERADTLEGWRAVGSSARTKTPEEEEALDDREIIPIERTSQPNPSPGKDAEIAHDAPPPAEAAPPPPPPKEPTPTPQELIVVFTLLASEGRLLNGEQIFAAMRQNGLKLGERDIFHYWPGGEAHGGSPLFSIANILEPGSFDADHSAALETPGIAAIMVLPTPLMPGAEAFSTLLDTLRNLAFDLEGELCDSQRQPLTDAAIHHLHTQASHF